MFLMLNATTYSTMLTLSSICQRRYRLLAVLCCGLSLTWMAEGAVKTWDGSSSGSWSVNANWTGNVRPVSGDDVVFPPGAFNQVNTNNLTGLQPNSITFTGSGYDIRGNAVTLAAGIAGQHTSGLNKVWLDCTIAADQSFDVLNGAASMEMNGDVDLGASRLTLNVTGNLEMGGGISGSGGVSKNGSGTARFDVAYLGPLIPLVGGRPNTYTGRTYVFAGTLELRKTRGIAIIGGRFITISDIAIAGDLTIGSSSVGPDVVRFDDFGGQIADAVSIAITPAGLLDLHNQSDSIGPLTMEGGQITTGSGVLTLLDDMTAKSVAVGTYPHTEIHGRLNLNTTRTFTAFSGNYSPALRIYATIGGAGGLTKTGLNSLYLMSSNSYSGTTTISQGQIMVQDSSSLGSTSGGTIVNNGAGLVLRGVDVGTESLNLAGPGATVAGAVWSVNLATSSWAGPITLDENSTIGVVGSTSRLVLSGTISGPGDLTKLGEGTLIFSGASANSYAGDTYVNEGTLELAKPGGLAISSGILTIGTGSGAAESVAVREMQAYQIGSVSAVVNADGLLDLNGSSARTNAAKTDRSPAGAGSFCAGESRARLRRTKAPGQPR